MALQKKLTGSGFAPLQAVGIVGDADTGAPGSTGAVATGSNQATAYQISGAVTVFGTVAASTGAILPSNPSASTADTVYVINAGSNALTIYPPVGGYINALAVNSGYSLAANTMTCLTLGDPLNQAHWYTH